MKGRLLKLALVLLLGAIVNVAVAWACSSWAPLQGTITEVARKREWDWSREASIDGMPAFVVGDPLGPSWLISGTGAGVRYSWIENPAGQGSSGTFSAGWPALSHSYEASRAPTGVETVTNAVRLPDCLVSDTSSNFAPVRLIWPGFAVNTILYALILWLLLAAQGRVRHRLRRERGLCPACAYPVGKSAICTECGQPVRPRAAS